MGLKCIKNFANIIEKFNPIKMLTEPYVDFTNPIDVTTLNILTQIPWGDYPDYSFKIGVVNYRFYKYDPLKENFEITIPDGTKATIFMSLYDTGLYCDYYYVYEPVLYDVDGTPELRFFVQTIKLSHPERNAIYSLRTDVTIRIDYPDGSYETTTNLKYVTSVLANHILDGVVRVRNIKHRSAVGEAWIRDRTANYITDTMGNTLTDLFAYTSSACVSQTNPIDVATQGTIIRQGLGESTTTHMFGKFKVEITTISPNSGYFVITCPDGAKAKITCTNLYCNWSVDDLIIYAPVVYGVGGTPEIRFWYHAVNTDNYPIADTWGYGSTIYYDPTGTGQYGNPQFSWCGLYSYMEQHIEKTKRINI